MTYTVKARWRDGCRKVRMGIPESEALALKQQWESEGAYEAGYVTDDAPEGEKPPSR
jgi:hypothetical protein